VVAAAAARLAFGRLRDKRATWMFVAGGAALIAVKETWELLDSGRRDGWDLRRQRDPSPCP
jgi:hypothetical protein